MLLGFADSSDPEKISASITALVVSAIERDGSSQDATLSQLHSDIVQRGAAQFLVRFLSSSVRGNYLAQTLSWQDPLNTLPLLLRCRDQGARDILALMGECSSAKEVVIAVQEAVETLEQSMNEFSDDEGDENLGAEGLGAVEQSESSSSEKLATLLGLYTASIPRIKMRRKTPLETITPLLAELQRVIVLAGPQASRGEGREIISKSSHLCKNILLWSLRASDSADELSGCNNLIKSLMDATLSSFAHCIQSSIAQRAFETLFPLLTVRSTIEAGWEAGEAVAVDAIGIYPLIGHSEVSSSADEPVIDIIRVAYSPLGVPDANRAIPPILAGLLACIQSNVVLDEVLGVLITTLRRHREAVKAEISPPTVVPLATILPSLASSHPDPLVRHQAFRILSLLLSLSPQDLRFQILSELINDSSLPQMRVAAVGLIKEAVLQALDSNQSKKSLFSSPALLQTFGPTLFRPSPPDLLQGNLSLKDFSDSFEPRRLVECLSFYYVLLVRDRSNATGVRDPDMIQNIEKTLLDPLRIVLARWSGDQRGEDHTHDMVIIPLQLGLERIEMAKSQIDS